MNLSGIGSAIAKFFSTGVDVGARAPAITRFNLSAALSRAGNSPANFPTATPERLNSGISGHSGGIASQVSGVKPGMFGPIKDPRGLTIPPMAMKAAIADYNAKVEQNSAVNSQKYTPSYNELNAIGERMKSSIGQSQGNIETTIQEGNNEPLGGNTKNLPPIALSLMAELAKHEAEKGSKGLNSHTGQSQGNSETANQEINKEPLGGNTKNLPPIALRLMAELAKHKSDSESKEPISSDSAMGVQLRAMVDNFEQIRHSPTSTLERTPGRNESEA